MSIRNDNLGGNDWNYQETNLKSTDLNDTFNSLVFNSNAEKKDNLEQIKLDVTTSSSSVSFSSLVNTTTLIIANEGDTTAYLNFGATASTTDFAVLPNQIVSISNVDLGTQFSAITSTASTTLKILGMNSGTSGQNTSFEILNFSTSSTTNSSTFTNTTDLKDIIVVNDSSIDTYINFGADATTDNLKLLPNEYFVINRAAFNKVSGITDGSTGSISVLGIY